MSERKVLTKYYPPDFDPSKIVRSRGPKPTGPKQQTVRLMAPFSMKCTACGEYIYKGRKFNARKETSDERYYSIPIFRFYIRCTRCSAEITFKTDPKNMDYTCEKGARRNFEPWRDASTHEETPEERLDRLEREEQQAEETAQAELERERNAMAALESKTLDAKREMQIADALDEIRTRNARIERGEGVLVDFAQLMGAPDAERERQEREDAEAARRAFETEAGEKVRRLADDDVDGVEPAAVAVVDQVKPPAEADAPVFKRVVKKKKDLSAALGIKKKQALV
jgi:hypothetical protein